MASILDLSPEILLMCLGCLYDQQQGMPLFFLRSLNLVCRRLHFVTSELLFHNVNISFSNGDNQVDHDTASLLAFLHNNANIRACVRTVSILSDIVHGPLSSSRYFAHDSLERLLPLLPKLQHVRLTVIDSDQKHPRQHHHDPLFTVIEKLGQVRTSLTDYSHSRNPHPLEISRLSSLNISAKNRKITTILKGNEGLKHLGVCIDSAEPTSASHGSASQRLPPDIAARIEEEARPVVESLSLNGATLHQSDRAWLRSTEVAANLRSLSLVGPDLCREIMGDLQGSLSCLETLKVALGDGSSNTLVSQSTIENFLTPLSLTQLSLVGCPSGSLSALNGSRMTLRRLCFHNLGVPRQTATMTMRTTPTSDHIFLAQDLDNLGSMCKSLEWLAFDVEPFSLSGDNETGIKTPVTLASTTRSQNLIHNNTRRSISSSAAPIVPFVIINGRPQQPRQPPAPSPQTTQPHSTSTSDYTRSPQQDSSTQESSVFQALIPYRFLRHLRLFVRSVRDPESWDFSTTDAIHTYLYYYKEKTGCKLESLTIHSSGCSGSECEQSWTIFEMGERRVCVSNGPVQQIWDVSDHKCLRLVEQSERRFSGYHHYNRLFKADNQFRFPVEWSKDLRHLC